MRDCSCLSCPDPPLSRLLACRPPAALVSCRACRHSEGLAFQTMCSLQHLLACTRLLETDGQDARRRLRQAGWRAECVVKVAQALAWCPAELLMMAGLEMPLAEAVWGLLVSQDEGEGVWLGGGRFRLRLTDLLSHQIYMARFPAFNTRGRVNCQTTIVCCAM